MAGSTAASTRGGGTGRPGWVSKTARDSVEQKCRDALERLHDGNPYFRPVDLEAVLAVIEDYDHLTEEVTVLKSELARQRGALEAELERQRRALAEAHDRFVALVASLELPS